VNRLVSESGESYAFGDPRWRSDSGGLLDLEFDGRFDPDALSVRPATMWRYREALPILDDDNIATFGEGFTPLTPAEILGRTVYFKLDHLFPSGSYKDRGASVLISRAKEMGVDRVVEDSSGNAGAAVAAYCAGAGIGCDIYVPESTSPAKLTQIEAYGAVLHRIPGSREDTARAAFEAAQDVFYASHVWNPFFFHGTKTFAYEVWEQLGRRVPDTVVVPTGNGTLLIGAFLGFRDLLNWGLADRLPCLVAVQAANCAPLHHLWQRGAPDVSGLATAPTLAEGIAIAEPARAEQILRCVRESNGQVVAVTEGAIDRAWRDLARAGWFVEPTSASAVAALAHVDAPPSDTVVLPLTGHGLKTAGKHGS